MADQLPGLSIAVIRENPSAVKRSLEARGLPSSPLEAVLTADALHREGTQALEEANRKLNELSKLMKGPKQERFEELKREAKEVSALQKELKLRKAQLRKELAEALQKIPNLVHEDSPVGGEDDYRVIGGFGEKPQFNFTPKAHFELGEALQLYDAPRGVKVSGSRFVFLKGAGAILEKALLDYALGEALKAGFTPLATPTLVRRETMEGTGFTTKHNDEIYYLPADELYLTGTSEVALAGYHADELLELEKPALYAGISTCYRREAGAAGKDTRGLIRLHQFTKLEGFVYCKLEDAEEEHEKLLRLQERILQGLGLHYRVIDTATGDLGTSAYRKFDIEAWLPSQERYLELTSSSNCLQYQASQLNIRRKAEKGSEYAATLNGTLATTRWLVALLEQLQREDGSVPIPEVLLPYCHGIEELRP